MAIWQGARGNLVGGVAPGQGNLISGNSQSGIWIGGAGTALNRVLGNIIGANRSGDRAVGQGFEGVMITEGAVDNQVGDGTIGGRNLLSGNARNGVRIADPGTMRNSVRGNHIGTNLVGTAALANGLSGVEISLGAGPNTIGLPGQGNLLSGNLNHGIVITGGAHDNFVQANTIGPDTTGSFSLGNHPFGGIDIAEDSDRNQIGGLGAGEGNQISGNGVDGIAIFDNTGRGSDDNRILGNLFGLARDGSSPLPNRGIAIGLYRDAVSTLVQGNRVAYNDVHGVWVASSVRGRIAANTIWRNKGDGVRLETCAGNTVTRNTIYENTGGGIIGACPGGPAITSLVIGPNEGVVGTAPPNATIEIFSGDDDEARTLEASVTADGTGAFRFDRSGPFGGNNLTMTSTDAAGNTSSLTAPAHLQWTFLLYFNGDNNLAADVAETVRNLVGGGPSPRANVLALVDLRGPDNTVLYDVTRGQLSQLASGERDMGDQQTLIEFVNAGRARYPARHTMLSILDHGGGWAPGDANFVDGALASKTVRWLAGSSGLSWDEYNDYNYLGSGEMREAMAAISAAGGPLDVVYYDACLMGLVEAAHQLEGYARYFVSSQNIAWSPIGDAGRYSRLLAGLPPLASPRQLAELLVQTYVDSMPLSEHPYSIAAVDLAALPAVVAASDQLAATLALRLSNSREAAKLLEIYQQTQKIDYDSDLKVEPATDGLLDLFDFAARVQQGYDDPEVDAAAGAVQSSLATAVIAERHRSGRPWMLEERPEHFWGLDNLHGLSIFLPLGEDLELRPPPGLVPALQQEYPRLRSTYTAELRFVAETRWKALIDSYYGATAIAPPVRSTNGPVDSPLLPDFTSPETTITVTGELAAGQSLTIDWSARDEQSGVELVRFVRRLPTADWELVAVSEAPAGSFAYAVSGQCDDIAVYAIDGAGNIEFIRPRTNGLLSCDLVLPQIVR